MLSYRGRSTPGEARESREETANAEHPHRWDSALAVSSRDSLASPGVERPRYDNIRLGRVIANFRSTPAGGQHAGYPRNPRARGGIDRATGGLFILMGTRLAWSR